MTKTPIQTQAKIELKNLKRAALRLDDAINETERFSDSVRSRGEACWLDRLKLNGVLRKPEKK